MMELNLTLGLFIIGVGKIRAQAIYSHCICPTSLEVTVDTTMYGKVDNHVELNKLAN